MKVIPSDPSRSGKLVLPVVLKQVILAVSREPYSFVITTCPDTEGAWCQVMGWNDPELAMRRKELIQG